MFRVILGKEQQRKIAEWNEYYAAKMNEFAGLTNDNLLITAEHYLRQMDVPRRFQPDQPIYDATFFYALLPEIFRRILKMQEVDNHGTSGNPDDTVYE